MAAPEDVVDLTVDDKFIQRSRRTEAACVASLESLRRSAPPDVLLACAGGRTVAAHQTVLAAHSGLLKRLFLAQHTFGLALHVSPGGKQVLKQEKRPADMVNIFLPDFSSDHVRLALDFFYCGEILGGGDGRGLGREEVDGLRDLWRALGVSSVHFDDLQKDPAGGRGTKRRSGEEADHAILKRLKWVAGGGEGAPEGRPDRVGASPADSVKMRKRAASVPPGAATGATDESDAKRKGGDGPGIASAPKTPRRPGKSPSPPSPEPETNNICPFCPKGIPAKQGMRNFIAHAVSHVSVLLFPDIPDLERYCCPRPGCLLSFKNRFNFIIHLAADHDELLARARRLDRAGYRCADAPSSSTAHSRSPPGARYSDEAFDTLQGMLQEYLVSREPDGDLAEDVTTEKDVLAASDGVGKRSFQCLRCRRSFGSRQGAILHFFDEHAAAAAGDRLVTEAEGHLEGVAAYRCLLCPGEEGLKPFHQRSLALDHANRAHGGRAFAAAGLYDAVAGFSTLDEDRGLGRSYSCCGEAFFGADLIPHLDQRHGGDGGGDRAAAAWPVRVACLWCGNPLACATPADFLRESHMCTASKDKGGAISGKGFGGGDVTDHYHQEQSPVSSLRISSVATLASGSGDDQSA